MKEALSVKKMQMSIVAVAMAAIVALGMGAFAQQAYAEDALPYGKTATKTIKGVKYTFINKSASAGVGLKAVKSGSAKSVNVPATVTINGHKYAVKYIEKGAFKSSKAKTVTLSKNVTKVKANAFKGSKVTKVILKTKALKKSSVKNSLKSSKVKTVQVKVGSKAQNKKYVKSYKKIFTKKNAGKKVTVK